jgi:glycosyltransferase involved in cell wall biosynthesis
VCLGRRGGSIQLTKAILGEMKDQGTSTLTALSKERNLDQSLISYGDFEGKFSAHYLIKTLSIGSIIEIWKLCKFIQKNQPHSILWVMGHPLDVIPRIVSKILGLRNFSIIHEMAAHAGEFWPPELYNRIIINLSSKVLFLSRSEASKFSKKFPSKQFQVIRHPEMKIERSEAISIDLEHSKFFLFIGRIQPYKGLSILGEAWRLFKSNIGLVVAGEGRIPEEIKNLPRTQIINRWLSEGEMKSLTLAATGIIFPYTEGSQSGVMNLDEVRIKHKLLTDVPGLVEYADSLSIVVEKSSSSHLLDGLYQLEKISKDDPSKYPSDYTPISWREILAEE